jgi:hypothetical protein
MPFAADGALEVYQTSRWRRAKHNVGCARHARKSSTHVLMALDVVRRALASVDADPQDAAANSRVARVGSLGSRELAVLPMDSTCGRAACSPNSGVNPLEPRISHERARRVLR